MRTLQTYICESSIKPAVIDHFNEATVRAMNKVILKSKITFEINGYDCKNIDIYKKGNYAHITFDSKSKYDSTYKNEDGMFYVSSTYITVNGVSLDLSTRGRRAGETCNLVEFVYEKGHTKCVFELDYHRAYICKNSTNISGKITVEFPGDLTNVKMDYSNFDCKGYDKFMKEFLPKKADYLRQIDLDDVENWNSKVQNNILYIDVTLPTGKGYSSHHRRVEYVYVLKGASYSCNRKLYDADYEAQIVRKFESGISEFLGKDYSKMPENVIITIEQELD